MVGRTAGNSIAANSKMSFLQTDGVIQRRVYLGIEGGQEGANTALIGLTNAPAWLQDKPDIVDYRTSFEGPTNTGTIFYGTRFRGYVTAPTTGNYVFFLCADDNAQLLLSTDDNPANAREIAYETVYSNPREYQSSTGGSDLSRKRSDQDPDGVSTITLTAGKRYYIEVIHKQGSTVGDNISVAWQIPGGNEPQDGDPPIPGKYLSAYGVTAAPVSIATQPASQTILEPAPVTFSVVGAGFPPPTHYQWLRNGVPIEGATSTNYTLSLTKLADSGTKFSVQLANAYSTVTSSDAILTVSKDTEPPTPMEVGATISDGKIISVTFNEMLDKASAELPQNYVFTPGNIAATAASLDTNSLKTVTITAASTLAPSVATTLTISGVKDLAGNPVASGANIQFIVTPVTYQANILFDKPLGYYRFEETSGSVAKNSGTTGVDGAYYSGDEATPGAGGSPSSPKGAAGPRPPAFVGFDANNHCASFDGVGEWIDTKNQLLNGLGAFSLEYWVSTADLANQPARVGIVGQNDAIEYGFIDNNTIQIWTPGGGSLDTDYTFADNEWHHVATIASGQDIRNYFDGVLVGTGGSATSNYGTSAYNVHIGGAGIFDITGNWFNGSIDEVAIFDKAIPAERIAAHYAAGKQGGSLVQAIKPPMPVQVNSINPALNVVEVSFAQALDRPSAETAKNYVFSPGNIAASTAVLDAVGTKVTLTTSGALTPNVENTLTLNGIKDQTGLATVVAGTSIKFTFNPVTYEANILFDQPLAYYRFEETSGSVAKNNGTTGGDGAYFTGDEASPGAGGTPSSPKGDPGPRPPTFVGFDASNRSATFDGVGEWVDTKNQFLNKLGAFSLEYWVKPADLANQPARVGIVGQNDTIEYGFIDNNTIQIWTPGGGSLDTDYPFPDNEWHHVATIASGTDIRNYFDAKLVGSGGTATSNYGTSAYNVHIGGAGVFDITGNWFNGNIDEVAIFDKAIPADRIAAHYKAGKEGGLLLTSGAVTPGGGGGGTVGNFTGIAIAGGQVTITWTSGTLLSSPTVTGTYNPVAGATSPFKLSPTGTAAFYQLKP